MDFHELTERCSHYFEGSCQISKLLFGFGIKIWA